MAKYVSIAYLFENRSDITDPKTQTILDSIELLYQQLGERIAEHFDIELGGAVTHENEKSDLPFYPKFAELDPPALIGNADPSGTWGDAE